jgi:hypothetical protein
VLPNLIIIGGMKCGTTSLHYYLGLHPEISMSRQKEVNFFIREANWDRGIGWYESHFTGEAKVYGESSPQYTNYPFYGGVPERMASVVPQAKLIYMVRDPVERIVSHYVHNRADGRERRPISEVVGDPNGSYLRRSKYYMQLSQYLNCFPERNIMVVTQEELHARRAETLRSLFQFLEVDATFHSEAFSRMRNTAADKHRKSSLGEFVARAGASKIAGVLPEVLVRKTSYILFSSKLRRFSPLSEKVEKPVLDEYLREKLCEQLREDADRLRAFTGRRFEDWCV